MGCSLYILFKNTVYLNILYFSLEEERLHFMTISSF